MQLLLGDIFIIFHFFERGILVFLQLADSANQQLRNLAVEALDQSIGAVLVSDHFPGNKTSDDQLPDSQVSTFTRMPCPGLTGSNEGFTIFLVGRKSRQ